MTTANKITIGRIILVPVFILLMLLDFPGHKLAALKDQIAILENYITKEK